MTPHTAKIILQHREEHPEDIVRQAEEMVRIGRDVDLTILLVFLVGIGIGLLF